MPLLLRLFFVVGLLSLSSASAATPTQAKGNLVPILNAFIASVAKSHTELKTDIRLWKSGDAVRPGDQIGKSASMGTYSFRPKTWAELSADEQASVFHNPSLKAFIISMRNARIYPVVTAANADQAKLPGWFPVEGAEATAREYHATIAPDEMLRTRPTVIHVETRATQ